MRVKVVKATLREGSRSNGTAWREWDLELECGCGDFCAVRYEKGGQRGWGAIWHPQPLSKALPAPKWRKHKCSKTND